MLWPGVCLTLFQTLNSLCTLSPRRNLTTLSVHLCLQHADRATMRLVMAAQWNRAGHYIFILWFLLSSFFFFLLFLVKSQRSAIGCRPYFRTWCGLSANLQRMSETCCRRLADNTGRQNDVKKSPPGHHPTNLSGYIFATKARIDNRRKTLLSSNMSSRCPHNMVNFGPLAAEIDPVVCGTPANFNGFRGLTALLHGSQVVSVSQNLRR